MNRHRLHAVASFICANIWSAASFLVSDGSATARATCNGLAILWAVTYIAHTYWARRDGADVEPGASAERSSEREAG